MWIYRRRFKSQTKKFLKCQYFGHIVEGTRERARPWKSWIGEIIVLFKTIDIQCLSCSSSEVPSQSVKHYSHGSRESAYNRWSNIIYSCCSPYNRKIGSLDIASSSTGKASPPLLFFICARIWWVPTSVLSMAQVVFASLVYQSFAATKHVCSVQMIRSTRISMMTTRMPLDVSSYFLSSSEPSFQNHTMQCSIPKTSPYLPILNGSQFRCFLIRKYTCGRHGLRLQAR